MEKYTRKLIKFGSSIGLTFDNLIRYVTGFKLGEEVEVELEEGKLIISKKEK